MEKSLELQTSQIINNRLVFEKEELGFNKALGDRFFCSSIKMIQSY